MRRPGDLIRGLAVLAATTAALTAPAAAQSRVEFVPSIAAGYVYDDNLFYRPEVPDDQPALDAIWRITPGVTLTRESRQSRFIGRYLFDAERYRDHPDLNLLFARQHGSIRVTAQPRPRVAFALDGGVDATRTPSELNLTSGLLTSRRPAWRSTATPAFTVQVAPRVELLTQYRLVIDHLSARSRFETSVVPGVIPELVAPSPDVPAPGDLASTLVTHEGTATARYGITGRHQLTAGYTVRRFSGDRAPSLLHVPTIGWIGRVSRSTRISLAAGPRLGGEEIGSEIAASIEQTLRRVQLTAGFDRTVTTAIGLSGVLNVDRGYGSVAYRMPGSGEAAVRGGVYRSTFAGATASVYQVGANVMRTIAGPLAISASYAMTWQRGRFGGPVVIGEPEERLRRGVAAVQLVLSPSVRAVEADAEEQAARRNAGSTARQSDQSDGRQP